MLLPPTHEKDRTGLLRVESGGIVVVGLVVGLVLAAFDPVAGYDFYDLETEEPIIGFYSLDDFEFIGKI